MPGTSIGIGLAGLGRVGSETVRLLLANRAGFRRKLGRDLRLAAVCDRRACDKARGLGLPGRVRRTERWRDLLEDPSVDIVVELFGGEGAARLVLGALSRGKPVVTANKLLLSRRWNSLFREASQGGARLYYEASVAGGIPALLALREGLAADRILSVRGILNATTNLVLTEMSRGCSLERALDLAREAGLAERDASLDLSGADAAHKLSVLASMISGTWLDPARIPRQGIEGIEPDDLLFASEKLGRRVRLIGSLAFSGEGASLGVEAHVRPTLVPESHPLAAAQGAANALLVDASPAGSLTFSGPGAGPGPAASAVAGDVLLAGRDLVSGAPAVKAAPAGGPLALSPESPSPFFLRLGLADRPGSLAAVAGALARRAISIDRIYQEGGPREASGAVPVRIVTHPASYARVREALAAIRGLGACRREPLLLRVLP